MDEEKITKFVGKIKNFNTMKHSPRILLLGYYLQNIENVESFNSTNIGECYDFLDVRRPENLSDLLNKLSGVGKLIPKKSGFRIVKQEAETIEKIFGDDSTNSIRFEKAYGHGDSYEFYDDVKKIIESATKEVFLVDSYATEDIINLYLNKLSKGIKIMILTNKPQGNFAAVATKFKTKHQKGFSVKTNKNCHDRIFFVDKKCYVTGQSLDKAASKQPTYLCEITNGGSFRNVFQKLFNSGKTLF